MPALKYQIVPSLGEFGAFESKTGGDLSVAYTTYFEAGSRSPRELPGTHSYSAVSLSRAYDAQRDRPLENWVRLFKSGLEGPRTLTVMIKNEQGVIVDTKTYPVAKPETITNPEGAAGDSGLAELRLTLRVEDQTF